LSKDIWDASVVLALVQEEPGWEGIAILEPGYISAVNQSEVVARLADRGISAPDIDRVLNQVGLEVIPLDEGMAVRAGILRPVTRDTGLSLGDRCCLALAQTLGRPVLTCDRAWGSLDLDLEIRLMR
jgi:ribonuclease VapC